MKAQATADHRQARLRFGNPAVVREDMRDAGIVVWLDSVLRDTRYALAATPPQLGRHRRRRRLAGHRHRGEHGDLHAGGRRAAEGHPRQRSALADSDRVDQQGVAGGLVQLAHRQHRRRPHVADARLVDLAACLPPAGRRADGGRLAHRFLRQQRRHDLRARPGRRTGRPSVRQRQLLPEPRRGAAARPSLLAGRRPRGPRGRGRDQPPAVATDVRGPRRRHRLDAPRQRRADDDRRGGAAELLRHLHRRVGGRLHAAGREGDADARPRRHEPARRGRQVLVGPADRAAQPRRRCRDRSSGS